MILGIDMDHRNALLSTSHLGFLTDLSQNALGGTHVNIERNSWTDTLAEYLTKVQFGTYHCDTPSCRDRHQDRYGPFDSIFTKDAPV
jgi:hypothetical protein